jgi:hypothetical protein
LPPPIGERAMVSETKRDANQKGRNEFYPVYAKERRFTNLVDRDNLSKIKRREGIINQAFLTYMRFYIKFILVPFAVVVIGWICWRILK